LFAADNEEELESFGVTRRDWLVGC
jgi:hypothetical protein